MYKILNKINSPADVKNKQFFHFADKDKEKKRDMETNETF